MVTIRFIKLISKTTLVVVFLIFTSFFNTVKAQYCLAPNSNLQIFPTNVAQVTSAYISGSARAFNFNATAGCSYYFATCGLAGGGDTFLRLYSLANGGTLLASWDDQCGTESSGTWICPSTGAYSVLLTDYNCIALTQNTSMTYSSNCGPCLLLAPTSVSGSTICQAGTTLISATPTSGANTIRWYNFSSGGTLLFTGNNYQPYVSSTTTYYAASYNSTSGCQSSSRTPVTVTFGSPSAPNSVFGNAICQAGTTLISATPTSGANTIRWYNFSSGGTLLYTGINYQPYVSSTTTYYAASFNSTSGCQSSSRTPVTVIFGSPSAPNSVFGNAICQAGFTFISATPTSGANTIRWYNFSSGGTLLFTGINYQPYVSSTTTYYAASYNSTSGCESSSRSAVTITFDSPSAPNSVSGSTLCQAGFTFISATPTSGANTIRWYNFLSGGALLFTGNNYQPYVSSTTTYYAASFNSTSGCESSSRTPVTVTFASPSAPTSVLGSTVCEAGTTVISAIPESGANTIRWYNYSSGGPLLFSGFNYQPYVSSTTTYYAASYNSTSGCESSSRTAVTVTFGTLTAPISVLGSAVCQAGTTLISATPESGANTIRWYNFSSGGTLLFTGFDYQPYVSSTTTYYAASYNSTSDCESSSRTDVTVTFGSLTGPTSVLGSTVCQSGITSISATPESGANTIRWYNFSSGGTLLFTGINYQPNVSSTNTYFAASYNSTNGCESLARFPVNLVVHPNPTISYSTTNSNNGENVAIEVIIKEGTGPYLFDWNFDGEGDFDDLQNQSSLAPGNYILVVKDNNGCKATAFILIESDYNLSIATGISPNNDGKNDKWIILGTQQFDDLEISIYDIFGQCINRQAKNYVPWDGYYNGALVPEGEYYFIIESVKKKKKITGTILIKY